MVRVFLKGGVWKNSEDEILKAAVQKYGKQQWARVASLLNRKTAKQAKARWHEWLDPSIRKTEWSRQEEEKLLHLAKLMPAQWKTIAPMVGRTAVQCQEHYETLLDQAAAPASGGDATSKDDIRKRDLTSSLRPGQIDSHPEAKPAKPDPIDMDEDEAEMLQEARARLANTQGKKAKRKQRERILAQAKRLADLQKRRELKQAGLLSSQARKKSKTRKNEIDLGVEIPFYKPAPAGFHDTAAESQRTAALRAKRLKNVDYGKVNENQYRTRDREAANAKKREAKRLQILQQTNEKYAGEAAQKKAQQEQDELPATFRGSLRLPAPTTTATAYASEYSDAASIAAGSVASLGGSGGPTQTLTADFSNRPLPTPMRGAGGTDLMREASALRQLERGQTPLLLLSSSSAKKESQEHDEMEDDATAMMMMMPPPDDRSVATAAGHAANMADDHSVGGSTFATTTTTGLSIRELARQERKAAKRARAQLEAALAALPAPQFEYELAVPEQSEEVMQVETVTDEMEADRADVEAAAREQERLAAEKAYQARSSVLKRHDLPRPSVVSGIIIQSVPLEDDGTAAHNNLIAQEMQTLLQHDAHAFPQLHSISNKNNNGKKKKKNKRKAAELMTEVEQQQLQSATTKAVPLENIPEAALNAAKQLIEHEFTNILEDKVSAAIRDGKASTRDDALNFLANENARVSRESAIDDDNNNIVYLPERGWITATSDQERIESMRHEFTVLQEATATMKKKNDKLASKLQVMNGGYMKRADKLQSDILQAHNDLEKSKIEESAYRMLQSHETQGGANRIQQLNQEIKELRAVEAELQQQYGNLVVQKRRLQVASNNSDNNKK